MLAIIDIGSNSVRLMLKEKNFKEKFCVVTKLAENKADNFLNNVSMDRTAKEVLKFIVIAKEKNADIHIFATEAVRSAKNAQEFLFKISSAEKIDIDILSGADEALAGFLGAASGRKGSLAVIDMGGASTEIAAGKGSGVNVLKSIPLGVVSLFGKCGKNKSALDKEIDKYILSLEEISFKTLIGVGGTITSLAAIDLNLKTYDSKKIDGHILYSNKVLEISDMLLSLNDQQTLKIFGVQKGRESTLAGGSYFLYRLMKFLKADKITVSDNDNLEGYIILNKLKEI